MSENKRNRLAKKSIVDNTVSFAFGDEGSAGNVSVDITQFPDEIQTRFAVHGLSQKLGDSYAGIKSPADAMDQVNTLVKQLEKGDWTAASNAAGPKAGKVVRALFRLAEKQAKAIKKFTGLSDVSLDSIRDWYASQTKEMKAGITKSPEIKVEMASMSMEDAQADTGTSLLS